MGSKKRAIASASEPLVPGEYMLMLREYNKNNKRKRKNSTVSKASAPTSRSNQSETSVEPTTETEKASESAFDHTQETSESDFDSDEFEDVQLENSDQEEAPPAQPNNEDLILSFNSEQASKLSRGPKLSGLSKPKRLLLHKISLATWLFHARLRNKWLLNKELLENPTLTNLLPKTVLNELFPSEHLTPFLKSKLFVDGLRHAMETWQSKFRVVRPGITSVQSGDDKRGESGNMEEYFSQILSLSGSLDLEGQGFVALLRAIGLCVRLVCSLQPPDNLTSDICTPRKSVATASAYPIFWAEVWDANVERWISLDSVTSTVRFPTRNKVKLKLEPPLSDRLNVMRYCVALNSHNEVRDVTRRYSSCFNSRTRKKRLDHFEPDEWLVRFFGKYANKKPTTFDKDEMLELSKYPRLEGIPTRVQDFVGHPQYALAEQLRHNEVLRVGAKPCGILSLKTKGLNAFNKNPGGMPSYIYSRSDVLTARSSQSWYRHGRSIKVGSQPQVRRDRKNKLTGELESVALYTYEQTENYKPPPIDADGTVPKSRFRTIDIFQESMIPLGGTYIKSNHGTQAAKILRIDFANVVTSVRFGKRGPQPNMFGVVVASQFAPAMHAVIFGLQDLEKETVERLEEVRVLGLWRKLIMGTQIWERVEKMNPARSEDDEHSDNVKEGSGHNPVLGYVDDDNVPEIKNEGDASKVLKVFELNDSDLETIGKSHLAPRSIAPIKHLCFSDAALQAMRSRVISSGFVEDDTIKREQNSLKEGGVNHSSVRFQPSITKNQLANSPGSYHSFSDLDVDEISESEL